MSDYTTELRFICESLAGLQSSVGYNQVSNVLAQARPSIFDFDYPIFDTAYKSVLETKILRHYYTREIGVETYGLWKLRLESKMNEIMPYYNQLYKSELYEFNPLYDVDLSREYTKSGKGESNSSAENNSIDTSEKQNRQQNKENETGIDKNNVSRETHDSETGLQNTENKRNTTENNAQDITKALSGGDTVTIDRSSNSTETRDTKDTKTRNLTENERQHEVTTNDVTLTTNSTTKKDGTTSGNGTVSQSGEDTVTSKSTLLETINEGHDSTETRDIDTTTNSTTNVLNKNLDTPQDNVNLLLESNYITAAAVGETTVEGKVNENGDIKTRGTSDTEKDSTTNTTGTTEYGKKETTRNDGTYNETDTGTGSQHTGGTVTRDLTAGREYGGNETNAGTGTVSTDGTGNEKSVTDSNRSEHTTGKTGTETNEKTDGSTETSRNLDGNTLESAIKNTENTRNSELTGNEKSTYDSRGNSKNRTQNTTLEGYIEHVKGRNGGRSFAQALNELRSTFLNIDMMIINDLSDLFFNLW